MLHRKLKCVRITVYIWVCVKFSKFSTGTEVCVQRVTSGKTLAGKKGNQRRVPPSERLILTMLLDQWHVHRWAGTRAAMPSATHPVAALNHNFLKWKLPSVLVYKNALKAAQKWTYKNKNGNGYNTDVMVCSVDATEKGLAINLRTLTGYTYSLGHFSNYFLEAWSYGAQTVICNVNMMYSLEVAHRQWVWGLTQCLSECIHPNRPNAVLTLPESSCPVPNRVKWINIHAKCILVTYLKSPLRIEHSFTYLFVRLVFSSI